ncbi:chromate transporter [Segetibacter koreensis]|uniref:chromate transporter n=1 Tax=Segetibacter koreensis TaxID=398037 RepID=UPI00036C4825
MNRNTSQVAKLLSKLGVTGFGGPTVQMALLEEEVVRKIAWMSEEHFVALVG